MGSSQTHLPEFAGKSGLKASPRGRFTSFGTSPRRPKKSRWRPSDDMMLVAGNTTRRSTLAASARSAVKSQLRADGLGPTGARGDEGMRYSLELFVFVGAPTLAWFVFFG